MAFIRSGGVRVLLVLAALVAFAAGAVAAGFYLSLTRDLPDLETIEDYRPPLTSVILDRDGVPIGQLASERRRLATIDEIPEYAKLAFVAAEDGGFYEHKGLDYTSIVRAALANLKAGGEIKQGASTITQQTVKSLLLTPERTFRRKFREMILARKIEQYLAKDEILYLYLNQIYFGRGAWGIAEAARTYFDKHVSDLTVSEAALLAGLPQRPNAWQPFHNPEAADKRRRYVLKRMLEDGIIDQPTYDEALVEPVEPREPSDVENFAPSAYFTELVRRYLVERFGSDFVATAGLTIETTLDIDLQKTAVDSLRRGLQDQDHRAGYRGPLRQVSPDAIEDELIKLAKENSLLPPEPEKETELASLDAPPDGLDGLPDGVGASPDGVGGPEESIDGTPKDEASADPEVEGELAELETPPLPELPFGERLVGVVVAVDSTENKARVSFAPGIEGEVGLDDVSWAREHDPQRRPRPVKQITSIFKVGDVANFVRLEDLPPDEETQATAKTEAVEGEEPEPPPARLTIDQDPLTEGSLLAIETKTGDVLSLVGGYDYTRSEFDRVTQALRQPGSAFKPFIYGAALARGYTPVQTLYDRPIVYEDPISGFKYKPENYERRFFGPVTMRFALAHSINNATVHLFRDLGVDYVIDFARRLGIQSHLNRDLSLAIGSSSVTLLELTTAYSVFPNGGMAVLPRFIKRVTDRDGQVLLENIHLGEHPIPIEEDLQARAGIPGDAGVAQADPTDEAAPEGVAESGEPEAIVSPEVAYLMCDLLKAVVTEGTGRNLLDLNRTLAGKTGTTNDFADAWFVGFSPDVTTGVWVGHDQAAIRLGWGESGARAALPIWKDYMRAAIAEYPPRDFDVPDDIEFARIDRATGLLADQNSRDVYFQPFLAGNLPTETSGDVSQSTDTEHILRDDAF